MQTAISIRRKADNIPCVGGDFWFKKNNMADRHRRHSLMMRSQKMADSIEQNHHEMAEQTAYFITPRNFLLKPGVALIVMPFYRHSVL
jgi:uncharacterized sporulation protein YeaH/YhbH (DUF444 family)